MPKAGMSVTYETFYKNPNTNGPKLRGQLTSGAACFSSLYPNLNRVDKVQVLLKVSPGNTDLVDFWLSLIKKIEPSTRVFTKNNPARWVEFKKTTPGKMRVITTVLRYLWEDTNGYDVIPQLTKNILKEYQFLDPLLAITLATATAQGISGYGHCHIIYMPTQLSKTWHYRRYNGRSGYALYTDLQVKTAIVLNKEVTAIRKKMKNKLDIRPILDHYRIDENYDKLKISYGRINSSGRSSRNG